MNIQSPTIYAIDFGTSNSLLAAANAERVFPPIALDPDAPDPSVLRSILYFTSDGSPYFGVRALAEYVDRGMDGRLLRSLKRFLPAAGFRSTFVGSRRYRLEELIGAMLRTMRHRANQEFGVDVRRVLLGRPARYSKASEEDTLAEARMREAASLAGFDQIDFCAEPTAAARDFESELAQERLVLVADFGGGTSDFSLVRMTRSGFQHDDVLATGGLSIAGDVLDGALMKHQVSHHFGARARYTVPFGDLLLPMPAVLMDLLCTPAKLQLLQARETRALLADVRAGAASAEDRAAVERLECVVDDALGFSVFEAVEATKRALSTASHAAFSFHYPTIDLEQPISRAQFEAACTKPVAAIFDCLDSVLQSAGASASDVDLVCLTGGTSRVPLVHKRLAQRFGPQRLRRLRGLHSVVGGLAHQARLHLASEN
jgi:hypothetical chaperone protein